MDNAQTMPHSKWKVNRIIEYHVWIEAMDGAIAWKIKQDEEKTWCRAWQWLHLKKGMIEPTKNDKEYAHNGR